MLPQLFEYMRDPKGRAMPPHLWKAVQKWRVAKLSDSRLQDAERQNGLEMAINWEAVPRLMQYRAARDARRARQMLVLLQAIDVAKKERLQERHYRRALQVLNMTKTGKLMGMLPLFIGMRVRFTAKLSAKRKIVQDAVGVVIGIEFHSNGFAAHGSDWRDNVDDPARKSGRVRLKYMPKAVHVRVDG